MIPCCPRTNVHAPSDAPQERDQAQPEGQRPRQGLAGLVAWVIGAALLAQSACFPAPTPPAPSATPALAESTWRVGGALASATRAVAVDSAEFERRSRQVSERVLRRDWAGLELEARRLLWLRPEAWGLWYDLAYVLWLHRMDPHGALHAAERCLERNPLSYPCRGLQGLLLAELGEASEAERVIAALLEEGVEYPGIREAAALLALNSENWALARERARALALADPEAEIRWHLIWATAAERLGDAREARERFAWIAGSHRDPIVGNSHYAAFLERQGARQEAQRVRRRMEELRRQREPQQRRDPL